MISIDDAVQIIHIYILGVMITHGTAVELNVVGNECPITLRAFEKDDEVTVLECGHGFSSLEIREWMMIKPFCPICRRSISAIDVTNSDTQLYRLMMLDAIYGCIDMSQEQHSFIVPLTILSHIVAARQNN